MKGTPGLALLQGLRRPGDETQLTRALASVFVADPKFAASFVRLLLDELESEHRGAVPRALKCSTEEAIEEGRIDLRFSDAAGDWDLIVELKIHAGYGKGQLRRYLGALLPVPHAYLVAITRDVPDYGEPARGEDPKWLGALRWRQLLDGLRQLSPSDHDLALQWRLFLDVLELEGSMGFSRPDPLLFDSFARARLANAHIEEFLRSVEHSLLNALNQALPPDSQASLYWRRSGRFSRAKWGKIDIPFRIPATTGPPRVRAGVIGWEPPTLFFVEPHGGRSWLTQRRKKQLTAEQERAVKFLLDAGFDPGQFRAYRALDAELLSRSTFETEIVTWARSQFGLIVESGLLATTEVEPEESEELL